MGPVVIKLVVPIEQGSEQVTQLEMRRPKAKDFRKLPANLTTSDLLNLAGSLCGQPPSVMDELDTEDFVAVMTAVNNFFPNGPQTGEKA